jgi:ABC-2 type transport system ATP-binding protein
MASTGHVVERVTHVASPPQPTVLQVREVTHSFGDRTALDGVSFAVLPGVLTGLLGPNGAGKTTVMRIMLGVLIPQRGQIWYRGRPAGDATRRNWGYMPQERGYTQGCRPVTGWCTSADCTACRAARRRKRRARCSTSSALASGGVSERTRGGLQQRLQLATALVHDPDVIVLDEPFAGLDPVAVASLSQSLRQRAREGRTVVFSSHQLDLVQDLCEDITMIDRGRTVLQGEVAALRASSGRRQLRLHVESASRDWLLRFPDLTVVSDEADDLRLAIPPGTDPLDVLDAARTVGRVVDFGLDLPTLSQLFLAAVGKTHDRTGVP